ncbi:MAG TPA: ABC transporter permease [Methanoregulaceae archaeon]|jgi:hypothetical protein|nr:ABC transporter permease [Methanolinea sp.]MCC7567678.1 ABC transporter permease [Methanoregulaceae archaeon]MDD3090354.1 ABC transporter permease [Methanoregulaceae archaeon]MDD5047359.1 ABC transporter permease [Methanoregulaceae archaeon]HOP66526.1 ABC transporter permease [Methanoregulaceae archaeon]
MSYLVYVAVFGTIAVFYLWLRDVRIFRRTGLAGYRRASYQGVIWGAAALFGLAVAMYTTLEILGLGIILGALYLQGRIEREKIWNGEGTLERVLGSARPR